MMSRKIIPWLAPICIGALYLTSFRWVHQYAVWYGAAACVVWLSLVAVIRDRVRSPQFLLFAISPVVFLGSVTGFLLFLEQDVLRTALLVIAMCFYGIYLHAVYQLGYEPSKYQPFSLEAISSYLNLVSVFCAAVVGYGFLVFLNVPLWCIALGIGAVLALTIAQSFWIHHIDAGRRAVYTATLTLVLVEFFWVAALLPIHFYVHGALVALAYYELWGIARAHALRLLNRRLILRYAAAGAVLGGALILTTAWT